MTSNRRSNLFVAGALLAGLALLPGIGCMAASDDPAPELDDVENSGTTFEEWVKTVYHDGTVYIVNGDTPVESKRELYEFFINHVQEGALIVHQAGGVDAKWSDAQKVNITYCVSTKFNGNYQKVVQAMTDAAGAWEAAANINFVHNTALDANCTANTADVVFDVNPTTGQQYLARAFFPNQGRATRNVLIDSSAFGNLGVWTLTGILRHELGHTLGFRHEHTRPEAGTCFEDNNYRPLTDYDSNSVMHYPQCNGTQKGDLVLTAKDNAGVAALYGAPGQNPPPGNPGGGACAHDPCSTGTMLDAGCDACVAQIGQADPYCVTKAWDSLCVKQVQSVCGQSCSVSSACVHDKCVTGAKLDASCDACVAKVVQADSFCGNNKWDSLCVSQVNQICGAGTCQ
jgi:hypothetical protein